MEPESQPTMTTTSSVAENHGGTGFNSSSVGFDWRQDLLNAADSVTSAMSSLVLEYNGGLHIIIFFYFDHDAN